MHLLLAQKGAINESEEAIDLGQQPADLIFLSAADTELASIGDARSRMDGASFDVRVANLMQLSHPMSVDVYAEKTLTKSRLIVVRVLGGESYWSYGLEKLLETALDHDIKLVVLPGDDKPDPGLMRFCTADASICDRFWAYLKEGGPQNAQNFLEFGRFLLEGGEEPPEPVPLLKAGLWWPGEGICGSDALQRHWLPDRPVVAICFYRALVQSGGLGAIEAMINALLERGLNVLPIFISSLKDPVTVETVRQVFSETSPQLVLNTTGFAVSSPAGEHQGTVLDEGGNMVLQIILSGSSKEAWQANPQGLSSRDLAMNVALPEVDGRVLARAIAFKSAAEYNEQVQASLVSHQPDHSRVGFVADLARNWINLREHQPGERRVAIVLANYPNRDGRLANGVGLDTPAGTVKVLHRLRTEGYQLDEFPNDGDGLIEHLQAGPTNAATDGREIRETLLLKDYNNFFAKLPVEIQNQVVEKWGEPEGDPFFLASQQVFALPLARFGNAIVGIQPARGYNIDP